MWLRSTSTVLLLVSFLTAQNPSAPKSPKASLTTNGSPLTSFSISPMAAGWSALPNVNGNIVHGSLIVVNQTEDDFDQTVLVEAVNEMGKAFIVGYQHFPLKKGSISPLIPFDTLLPPGHYTILADAIGEDIPKNLVHRIHLKAPASVVITTI
jgi:hypothetical protein